MAELKPPAACWLENSEPFLDKLTSIKAFKLIHLSNDFDASKKVLVWSEIWNMLSLYCTSQVGPASHLQTKKIKMEKVNVDVNAY